MVILNVFKCNLTGKLLFFIVNTAITLNDQNNWLGMTIVAN